MQTLSIPGDRLNGNGSDDREHAPRVMAALAAVLQRVTERSDLVFGYLSREAAAPVPIAVSVADDPSFPELVARLNSAIAAQPVESPASDPNRHWDAVVAEDRDPPPSNGFPLWLAAREDADGLHLSVHGGDPGRDTDPARLLGHLEVLLAHHADGDGRPISTLAMLTALERDQLLVAWNATEAAYPQRCLHELVADRAQQTPQATAVVCGSERLTYAELDTRANRLAHHLVGLGVGPETLVGISVERSVEMLVGLLGILKAGGAYVPVDPAYPAERQAFMLESSAAPVLVTQERLVDQLPVAGRTVVCLDRDWPAIDRQPAQAPPVPRTLEQLAYVIYTSGSTGQPKGVQIPHRALVNFLTTMAREPGLDSDDVLVAVTTLSFDIAGLELYLPLVVGAEVVIAESDTVSDPRALAGLLAEHHATVMQATPTTWRMLVDSGWAPARPLRALCGGEPLPVALADRLLDSGVELWNMYGPTETTIWSTCTQVTTRGRTLTIGRPIANTTIYILDQHRQPVPVGVAGELWIGGDGLARGYRGREDLTAERFIPHPFDGTPGARIYRTGDLARYRADGEIEFLGRIDNQVKVRGFRIELGEIETTLARHPAVAQAVVVARGGAGEAELSAYVIPNGDPASARELRDHAGKSLPPYMIPATVTTLDAFPLTPNGKVDRKALPEPSRERSSQRELVAARTGLEERLVVIWERELGIAPIGVTDDFFDLGVSSIVAATLFAAIERELGNQLPLGAIFRAPTIEALAALLEGDSGQTRWSSLVPIQPNGSQPPIFCVHGGAGTILHMAPLARRLGLDQPFYGLQARGLYGGPPPLKTVEEMATHYLSEMRQVHPGGPWRIGGYCFGSIVAFELAQRLVAAGETVELLMMFNGPSPAWIRRWSWYGNQPSWRAKEGLPEAPPESVRHAARRRRKLLKLAALPLLVPRALLQPRRAVANLVWRTRHHRARLRLRLGLPMTERMREEYFFEVHFKAERAYQPTPYPGEILVFYGENLYEDPTLGWDGLGNPVTTFAVPGEHTSNRQAMFEPMVGFVAEKLAGYLTSSADPSAARS